MIKPSWSMVAEASERHKWETSGSSVSESDSVLPHCSFWIRANDAQNANIRA